MKKIQFPKFINFELTVSLIIAITFFICVIFLILNISNFDIDNNYVKWGSPDETANYIFSKLYGQEGKLTISENYNLYTDNIMHPRSFRSDNGVLKPVSFLGMPILYGSIVKLTNYKIIPFLTPLIAAVAIIFFYLFIKNIFDKQTALASAFILSVFPPFIYYSTRSMFHNILFLSLLIFSLYFLTLITKKQQTSPENLLELLHFYKLKKEKYYFAYIATILSGLFLGLAISIRTSELLWLLPVYLIIWLFNFKRISIFKVLIFLASAAIALLPTFYYNQILFGNFYFGGYPEMNNSIVSLGQAGVNIIDSVAVGKFTVLSEAVDKIINTVYYFGFKPMQSLKMSYIYIFRMFSALSILSILGLIVFFVQYRKIKKIHVMYLSSLLVLSFVLITYYGSWRFFDNPDKNSHTIGNSYTRYWLPIYLGLMPFASLFLIKIARLFSVAWEKNFKLKIPKKIIENSLIYITLTALAFYSWQFVLCGSEEGLIFTKNKSASDKYQWETVIQHTESNSAIITQYHDKLFFPERKVIVGLFDDNNLLTAYHKLLDYLPLYYYNFTLPIEDLKYLNDRRLKEYGMQIKEVKKVTPNFSLYKLYPYISLLEL